MKFLLIFATILTGFLVLMMFALGLAYVANLVASSFGYSWAYLFLMGSIIVPGSAALAFVISRNN